MKTRLPRLPLFIDEIESLNHFIDVLNALDRHIARPQRAHVYAAWRSTINDRDSSYLLGRNVFVHASVPKGFYPEFVRAYAQYGHTPISRYARLNPTPAGGQHRPRGVGCHHLDGPVTRGKVGGEPHARIRSHLSACRARHHDCQRQRRSRLPAECAGQHL